MIRTGVNVGYSDEFRDRETNTPLLKSIAELPAKKGEPGKLMPPLPVVPDDREKAEEKLQPQLAVDPFRRDLPQAVATQDIWPWLVLAAACCFFADVFVRRVQINLQWLVPNLDAVPGYCVATRTACGGAGNDVTPAESKGGSRSVDRKSPGGDAVRAGCGDAGRSECDRSSRGKGTAPVTAACAADEAGGRGGRIRIRTLRDC